MEKLKPREIFLKACGEIAEYFAEYGFKAARKGQTLKKMSKDKDISFEIDFQSSHRNYESYIAIKPHIYIASKQLEQWETLQGLTREKGGILGLSNLGHITAFQEYKEWNLAGLSYENAVKEIIELLKKYVLPLFEIFETKENAIAFLSNDELQFNKWTKKNISCLPFMLCFATNAQAEKYFNYCIKNCNLGSKMKWLYKELANAEKIDLNHSEFFDAHLVKLAFVNGLKIGN
jgi:hypothetical protein